LNGGARRWTAKSRLPTPCATLRCTEPSEWCTILGRALGELLQTQEIARAQDPAAQALASEGTPALQAALRDANFEEGQSLLKPEDTLLGDLFRRIDESKDQGLERSEVIEHLKRVGIKAGFLGLVHSGIADKFMENLDTNSDGRVTMNEFGAVAKELLPSELFDADGNMLLEKLDNFLATLDVDGSGGIDEGELRDGTRARLPEGTSHAKVVANAAAKLGLDALDVDGSGAIDLEELKLAAEAVAATRASGG